MTDKPKADATAQRPSSRGLEIHLAAGAIAPVEVFTSAAPRQIKAIWRNEVGTARVTPARRVA